MPLQIPQRLHHIRYEGALFLQLINLLERIPLEGRDLLRLPHLWLARGYVAKIDVDRKIPLRRMGHVGAEDPEVAHPDAKLLKDLPLQRLQMGLTPVDLPPGGLYPQPPMLPVVDEEDLSVLYNKRGDELLFHGFKLSHLGGNVPR